MKTVLLMLVLAACGGSVCKDPAHVNDLQCVVTTAVVDCSTGAAINVAKEFEPIVFAYLSSLTGGDGTVNWAAFETSLGTLGLTDASCILAEIEQHLFKATGGLAAVKAREAQTFSDGLAAWRASKLPPGTKIKLPDGSLL